MGSAVTVRVYLTLVGKPDFSRDLENLSPNLSPTRREALNSPPSLVGKGAGGLGFPHDLNCQVGKRYNGDLNFRMAYWSLSVKF
jgi:hypothetical protein